MDKADVDLGCMLNRRWEMLKRRGEMGRKGSEQVIVYLLQGVLAVDGSGVVQVNEAAECG